MEQHQHMFSFDHDKGSLWLKILRIEYCCAHVMTSHSKHNFPSVRLHAEGKISEIWRSLEIGATGTNIMYRLSLYLQFTP